MNKNQTYLVGLVAAISIVAAVVWWIVAPKWVSLLSYELSGPSSQEVMGALDQGGIQYRVDDQSKSILVRSEDFQKSHRLLQQNGLPQEPGDGLEMFNNSDYGLSEFAQNINYQRGVEEELARTIMRLDGIKSVRVHLTIKKDSLFEDRKQEPRASVVVGFRNGVSYDSGKIRGIQEVVAAAIPNMRTENVAVITSQGNILSSSESIDTVAGGATVEDKYKNILTELLDGLLGSGEYRLSVNVRMDHRKKVTVEERIIPESSGKGLPFKVRSTSRVNEKAGGDASEAVQKSSDEEYLYSKEKSEIVYPIGEIANIAVGLVVLTDIDQSTRDLIEDLIKAALAMNLDRGDRIGIVSVSKVQNVNPVVEEHIPTALPIEQESMGLLSDREYILAIGVLSFLFLFSTLLLFLSYIRARRRAVQPLSQAEKELLVSDLVKWLERR